VTFVQLLIDFFGSGAGSPVRDKGHRESVILSAVRGRDPLQEIHRGIFVNTFKHGCVTQQMNADQNTKRLAERYGVSQEAVRMLSEAPERGGGGLRSFLTPI
jgi:hypothetical protein